jgi:8-oxo-dGTP pyrophosphatase MutT (NUDIX family)
MDGHTIDAYRKIEQRLKKALPGQRAQYRMAPVARPKEVVSALVQHAGVLVLLYNKNGQLHTVLTRRAMYEGVHSGQISLPGGKSEADDKNLTDTALRETHEEIGIDPRDIRVIGELTPLYIPVSNHMVQPVIGSLTVQPHFIADSKEVDQIYEIRLRDLLLPGCLIENDGITENNRHIKAPYYQYNGLQIWGATAMILSEFLELYRQSLH